MKLTINKLIANDIINYGMDKTYGFNYSVTLSEYLNDYEDKDKKYVLDNINEIIEDIEQNENVADLVVEEKDGDKEFDMVFYWENLLTPIEKIIYENAKTQDVDLEIEDIRDISDSLLGDNEFNDKLLTLIEKYDKSEEREL